MVEKSVEQEKQESSMTKKSNYFFIALYMVSIVMLFLMFKPYFSYLVLGGVIVLFLFPANLFLRKYIKNRITSSIIMTILVLLFILIPSIYIGVEITKEASNAYHAIINADYEVLSESASNLFGFDVNISEIISPLGNFIVNSITDFFPRLINSIADLTIKLFLMFFLIYYAFKEGDSMIKQLMDILPISGDHKKQLMEETRKVLYGVMHGQFLVALIQGVLGGLGFWIFGFKNPIFWGFIMAILAFIPMLGTPLVWVPASLMQLSAGNKVGAIGMLLFGAIIVMNIDNVLKPKLIGDKTGLHPLLVLLGIFGGIQFFGMIGMIIGPVIVAICILIIKFFNQDVIFA